MSHSIPEYSELFSRNIGLITEAEQERLRTARVAIAGLGGVGGSYAVTLARMGIGHFHISDMDSFEGANFNRQAGATLPAIGRKKADVIRETILSINPWAEVRVFGDGVQPGNVAEFLSGVDVVMDGLDFYALPARKILFKTAEERGIHVVTSGPIGMTTTLHVFGPGGMSFDRYFDFAGCADPVAEQVAFLIGVAPALLHLGQVNPEKLDFEARKAPSFGTAIQLCAGLACTEAAQILLKRRSPFLAPRYAQFDPVKLRLRRGYLVFGNRNPVQLFKRWALRRMLERIKRKRSERTS
ncbi:MAG: ThiF family adenylyltransferase [Oligoflexia bacterium]|nr:ThiF family adenylyltransferase [Oligoflexia bacterium]